MVEAAWVESEVLKAVPDAVVEVVDLHRSGDHFHVRVISESIEVVADLSAAEGFDLVVLVTAHRACLAIDWGALQQRMRHSIVYDGRRVLDLEALSALGWQAHAVGRPVSE